MDIRKMPCKICKALNDLNLNIEIQFNAFTAAVNFGKTSKASPTIP